VERAWTRRIQGRTKGRVAKYEKIGNTRQLRLSEREVQREIIPQEGGKEEEGVEAWEKEFGVDIS
jgi:hypothetical protein